VLRARGVVIAIVLASASPACADGPFDFEAPVASDAAIDAAAARIDARPDRVADHVHARRANFTIEILRTIRTR